MLGRVLELEKMCVQEATLNHYWKYYIKQGYTVIYIFAS